ncbi:MAG: ATP synthase F1 subunit epsilon [Bacteroidota bacterium]
MILTPDKSVFDGEIQRIMLPGSAGNFQVLSNHAPIVSILEKGRILYRDANREHVLAIEGGVVEVRDNKIVVLIRD